MSEERSEEAGEAPAVKPPPEVAGSGAAYARFFPEAQAVPAEAVIPMRADASLAYHNAVAGAAAVLEYADHVREHLPRVNLAELRSLPELAAAVAFAAQQVGRDEAARAALAEAYTLRRRLAITAEGLAESGALTAKEASKAGRRRGSFDVAADCITLAALLERKGDGAAAPEDLARAAELGSELKALLKPKGAKRAKGAAGEIGAAEALDRLWTLLVERHERLWAVGAYVFGHAVDDHVPPLLGPMPKRRPRGPA